MRLRSIALDASDCVTSINHHAITAAERASLCEAASSGQAAGVVIEVVDRLRAQGRTVDPTQLLQSAQDASATRDALAALKTSVEGHERSPPRSLVATDVVDLMELKVAVREAMLGKWLLQQSLNMIHARRGVGKTWLVLGIALALAAGVPLLGWAVDKPRNVLLVDGEMPLRALQDRLRVLMKLMRAQPQRGFLKIVTPDLLGRAAPDLGRVTDQAEIDELAADREVLILDNLSALLRSGAAENDAESWVVVSDWALQHRAAGRSVIFVHHSGKSGAQRGTSRREDLLDVVLALRNPQDFDQTEGARFEIHFEKARHLHGPEADTVEAALDESADGGWVTRGVQANVDQQIVERMELGLSLTEIGRELGLHKSNVSRRVRDMRTSGVLPADGSTRGKRNNQRNSRQQSIDV